MAIAPRSERALQLLSVRAGGQYLGSHKISLGRKVVAGFLAEVTLKQVFCFFKFLRGGFKAGLLMDVDKSCVCFGVFLRK